MMKQNCWEYMKCDRHPEGQRAAELGICPASQEKSLDGIHGGTNAGRACWVVAGSLCAGEKQGSFAQKFQNCQACNFYQTVKGEEHPKFELSVTLLGMLRTG